MVAMRDPSGAEHAVGRFTGWEPLGFEAGDNNWYRFVANSSVAHTDPDGLATDAHAVPGYAVTFKDVKRGKCGGMSAKLVIRLQQPAPCTGFTVQRVAIYQQIDKSCKGCPGHAQSIETPPTEEFWELFSETRQGKKDEVFTQTLGYTDLFGEPNHRGTCGMWVVERELRFFCASTIMQSGENPTRWPKGTESGIPSGSYPSRRGKPAFWDKEYVAQESFHFTARWDCCCRSSWGSWGG